jgi:hypothetical protein
MEETRKKDKKQQPKNLIIHDTGVSLFHADDAGLAREPNRSNR